MTGRSSMLAAMTFGSTPSGRVDLMRLMAVEIFCSAAERSVP
jgi:hypothetical protein